MKLAVRLVARGLFTIFVLDTILFGVAGRLNWPAAWTLTLLFFVFFSAVLVWGLRNAPDLLAERARPGGNAKSWDKVILKIYTFLLLMLLITAALDAGRRHSSVMPVGFQVAGATLFVLLTGIIWWTLVSNPFLSSRARIQADRNQKVATTGPYHYVRHPMYVAIILLMPAIALLLGSWWAMVPAVLVCPLFVVRTALEDRMLQNELVGYRDYANQVHYRLLPRIW